MPQRQRVMRIEFGDDRHLGPHVPQLRKSSLHALIWRSAAPCNRTSSNLNSTASSEVEIVRSSFAEKSGAPADFLSTHQCPDMRCRAGSQAIHAIATFENGDDAPVTRRIGNTHQLAGNPMEIVILEVQA